jgi:hypothetical protein
MDWRISTINDYFTSNIYNIDKNSFIYKYIFLKNQIVIINYKSNEMINSYGILIRIFYKR